MENVRAFSIESMDTESWKRRWTIDGEFKGMRNKIVRGIITDDCASIFV